MPRRRIRRRERDQDMAGLTRRQVLAGGAAIAGPTVLPAGAAAALLPRAGAQEAKFFRIATGPTDTGYFAIGTLLGNVVSSPPGARDCDRGGNCGVPGLIAVTQTTPGAVANVEAIREARVESALCQADIAYWAFHGTGPYRKDGAVRNLRAIANLYPEALHIVVRRDAKITELRHLRSKAVSLGDKNSSTLVTARAVLQAAGIPERSVKAQFLNAQAAADALREGKIDAMFEMSGLPSPVIRDLAERAEIDILPVDGDFARRLMAAYPFFIKSYTPPNAYRGVKETETISVGVLWVVGEEVDEKTIHGLTRALWHPNNRKTHDTGHPYGRLIRKESATEAVALQLHPGAALYYFEAGLIR